LVSKTKGEKKPIKGKGPEKVGRQKLMQTKAKVGGKKKKKQQERIARLGLTQMKGPGNPLTEEMKTRKSKPWKERQL